MIEILKSAPEHRELKCHISKGSCKIYVCATRFNDDRSPVGDTKFEHPTSCVELINQLNQSALNSNWKSDIS